MSELDPNHVHAGRVVKQERRRRGWTQQAAVHAGKPTSVPSWRKVEAGDPTASANTCAAVDRAFEWRIGTTEQLRAGEITEPPPGRHMRREGRSTFEVGGHADRVATNYETVDEDMESVTIDSGAPEGAAAGKPDLIPDDVSEYTRQAIRDLIAADRARKRP